MAFNPNDIGLYDLFTKTCNVFCWFYPPPPPFIKDSEFADGYMILYSLCIRQRVREEQYARQAKGAIGIAIHP